MSRLRMDPETEPPRSAGNGVWWYDTDGLIPCFKGPTGVIYARSENASVAAQSGLVFESYITNSDIKLPSFVIQNGSYLHWRFSISKTAAGTGGTIVRMRIGLDRVISDLFVWGPSMPAETAVADIGTLNVMVTARGSAASCTFQGTAWWDHRGTAASSTIGAGLANDGSGHVETSTSADISTLNGQYMGITLDMSGSTFSVTQCIAQAKW